MDDLKMISDFKMFLKIQLGTKNYPERQKLQDACVEKETVIF